MMTVLYRVDVGMMCLMGTVVTMFLGLYMPQLALPTWCRIVMVVYICFHAAVEMVLAIHMHASKCCPPANGESAIHGPDHGPSGP